MLPDNVVAALREAIARLLPDTCVIMAQSRTSDGAGGWSTVWTASGTVACRIDPQGGREQQAAGAIRPYTSAVVTLPHDAPVTSKDRLVISGYTYNITALDGNKSWPLSIRATVERVE